MGLSGGKSAWQSRGFCRKEEPAMNPVSATQTTSEPEKQPGSTLAIDFRSDTVTRPTPEMRRAMAEAVVGDDVFGEDPTVVELQEETARLFRREAALFVPTGCMGNQIAVRLHAGPGEEAAVEAASHAFDWELAAMAALSGVQARPLP